MTNDKGIFIKNIYYMLAYAFQVLRQKNYDNVAKHLLQELLQINPVHCQNLQLQHYHNSSV